MPLVRKRNDEFYTTYESIDNIYKTGYIDLDYFKDKKIYCNCDDYRSSNYVKWWKDNFYELGISELIATNYDNGDGAYIYRYDGQAETIDKGIDDGSFERYDYLIDADTVISTNPPFSKSRDYYNFLDRTDAKYYVHGTLMQAVRCVSNLNLTYFNRTIEKNIFYDVPSWDKKNITIHLSGIVTNVGFIKNDSKIELKKKFEDIDHEFYEPDDIFIRNDWLNCDSWKGQILNINKCCDIPIDYDDFMGVPITFYYMKDKYRKMFDIYSVIMYGSKFPRLRIKRKDC